MSGHIIKERPGRIDPPGAVGACLYNPGAPYGIHIVGRDPASAVRGDQLRNAAFIDIQHVKPFDISAVGCKEFFVEIFVVCHYGDSASGGHAVYPCGDGRGAVIPGGDPSISVDRRNRRTAAAPGRLPAGTLHGCLQIKSFALDKNKGGVVQLDGRLPRGCVYGVRAYGGSGDERADYRADHQQAQWFSFEHFFHTLSS